MLITSNTWRCKQAGFGLGSGAIYADVKLSQDFPTGLPFRPFRDRLGPADVTGDISSSARLLSVTLHRAIEASCIMPSNPHSSCHHVMGWSRAEYSLLVVIILGSANGTVSQFAGHRVYIMMHVISLTSAGGGPCAGQRWRHSFQVMMNCLSSCSASNVPTPSCHAGQGRRQVQIVFIIKMYIIIICIISHRTTERHKRMSAGSAHRAG